MLVSWAIPKGLPLDKKSNHLAVHTEDHPLEYASFEGQIPEGEYGGGKVIVWDVGTYDEIKWSDREVMVVLHGQRATGQYVLFATGRTGGKDTGQAQRGGYSRDWMVHRMDDAPPGYEPLPERSSPCWPWPVPFPETMRRGPTSPSGTASGRSAMSMVAVSV